MASNWMKETRIDQVNVVELNGKRIYTGRVVWPDGEVEQFYFEVDSEKEFDFTKQLRARWLSHQQRVAHGSKD